MTHPFSKAAVEAAAKAAYERWIEFDNWRAEKESNPVYARPSWDALDATSKRRWVDAIDPALSAAFEHARGEGMVRSANGWHNNQPETEISADTDRAPSAFTFPVTIIKDAGGMTHPAPPSCSDCRFCMPFDGWYDICDAPATRLPRHTTGFNRLPTSACGPEARLFEAKE